MTDSEAKFIELLRELFQFDCADLDFGIYRIMNHKRDVIEKFISNDLPKAITKELESGVLADQSEAARELTEVAKQITESLGRDALDADGNLVKFQETEIGKKYLDLKRKAAGGRGQEALEAVIFNHLYSFFSRYYQEGDFISRRRYSKRQKYAIPYNGEEVYLHWANHDQYYVKTAEHFNDYSFTSRGVTVHFKLKAADVEQNNVKGDKRFFVPIVKQTEWREKANELVIPFEYRPLTEQEEITFGKKNQQEAIITAAIADIPKQLKKEDKALAALTSERRKTADGEPVSYLGHHLRQYTRRNTSDFFIHKDLRGFLSRELDFYLKNEVLNLDEMEVAGEDRAEGWFQIIRVIKSVGSRIIDFLDQIESFQKMLWEKRKFVTETQYCITVGNIDEKFYPDIAACEEQWQEWNELFHIDEEKTDLFTNGKNKEERRIAFLKSHPTLVFDTVHIEAKMANDIASSFDNLEDLTDGILVHSENYQALNLTRSVFTHTFDCLYIDPPYNTGKDDFLYRDSYRHSSWLSMMVDRIGISMQYLKEGAPLFISLDEVEQARLESLLQQIIGSENYLTTFVWEGGRKNDSRLVSISHEYVLCFVKNLKSLTDQGTKWILRKRGIDDIYKKARSLVTKHGDDYYKTSQLLKEWLEGLPDNHPAKRHKHYWAIDERGVYFPSDIGWHGGDGPKYEVKHPVTKEPCKVPERGWMYPSKERMNEAITDGFVHFWEDHSKVPCAKAYLKDNEGTAPNSVFYRDRRGASKRLRNLLRRKSSGRDIFENPKDETVISELFEPILDKGGMVADFFAGSGTTGHAVINLNRSDEKRRRFFMVEMGDYFDTVLLPRIKKVVFTPEWKDGKPKRMATPEEAERSPRIIKYIRLESYEDSLNNIRFDDASGQEAMKFEDYLLKYMLKWETKHSETLLNVEKLTKPFSYKLHIHRDGQTREKTVDIPETFNYLLGLHVETRKVHDDDGRKYLVYRGRIDHRKVVIIWRETEGWKKADLERDKKFVAKEKLTEGADEVFVNGDSFIANAKALEPIFKARMFAPVEA